MAIVPTVRIVHIAHIVDINVRRRTAVHPSATTVEIVKETV